METTMSAAYQSIINYYNFLLTSNGAYKSLIPNYIFIFCQLQSYSVYTSIIISYYGGFGATNKYIRSSEMTLHIHQMHDLASLLHLL